MKSAVINNRIRYRVQEGGCLSHTFSKGVYARTTSLEKAVRSMNSFFSDYLLNTRLVEEEPLEEESVPPLRVITFIGVRKLRRCSRTYLSLCRCCQLLRPLPHFHSRLPI